MLYYNEQNAILVKTMKIKGTYGTAVVFTDDIQEDAVSQIRRFMNHESAQNASVRIMPDVHPGMGCVIGYTATLTDTVVPNLIGVDIGCGVSGWKLGTDQPDFEQVEKTIRNHVPHGFLVREEPYPDLARLYALLDRSVPFDEYLSQLAELEAVASTDFGRILCSLGSLGSGNHFIEINEDQSGCYWLVIHSRGL